MDTFPGKADVFFGTDDEDIISLSDDGTTVQFTGKQVGETILGAVVGEEEMLALIRVRAMDGGEINYRYAPPEDNYYIAPLKNSSPCYRAACGNGFESPSGYEV